MFSSASTAALALLALPSLISALALHPSPEALFRRADSTCGDPSYVQCAVDLPSDFCCPSTSTCMALAGKTTALCCPTGGDCSQIEAIPCDLSLEDKSKYPSATVMTSALTGTLETCGSKCCPFGYSCGDDGVCNIKADQSVAPSTGSSSSSSSSSSTTASSSTKASTSTQSAAVNPTTDASSSPTSTSDPSASSSADSSSAATPAADTTGTSSSSASSSSDTGAAAAPSDDDKGSAPASSAGLVAGGVIGGIAGIGLLAALILFFIKRERKRKELAAANGSQGDGGERASPSFGSSPPQISQPILNGAGTWRSDFSRKASTREGQNGEEVLEDGAVAGSGGPMYHHDPDDFGRSDDNYEVSEHDNVSYIEELVEEEDDENERYDTVPRIVTPAGGQQGQPQMRQLTGNARAVSSMYASYYDPNSSGGAEYQAPLKMPSARAFGGNDARVSVASNGGAGGHDWLGDPLRDSYGYPTTAAGSPRAGGSGVTDGSANGFINVFADSNALAPSPLEVGEREKRETRFSDFGNFGRGGQ